MNPVKHKRELCSLPTTTTSASQSLSKLPLPFVSEVREGSAHSSNNNIAYNAHATGHTTPAAMTAGQPVPPASNDMLSGLALENAILQNAIKKICNPLDKTFFLGMLAGVWVGFGGMAALSVAGGIPEDVRSAWPFLPKLGVGLFFPFGMSMACSI